MKDGEGCCGGPDLHARIYIYFSYGKTWKRSKKRENRSGKIRFIISYLNPPIYYYIWEEYSKIPERKNQGTKISQRVEGGGGDLFGAPGPALTS